MTEHEHEDEYVRPMFYAGAQSDSDGDMLPKSFTVFSPVTSQDEAIMVLLGKIAADLEQLDITVGEGMICFHPIHTWEQFAALQIDDHTKMVALGAAIAQQFLGALAGAGEKIGPLIKAAWVPQVD